MSDRPRAVVIGAGLGGLALAVRLQARGLDVTVFERRERVGGRAYQLVESGYTFDMGPSLITAPGVIDGVFRAAGRTLAGEVELVPLDPFYRIHFHDGTMIDYCGDADRMKAQMRRFHAGDAERYDAFMAAIRPIYEAVIEDRLGAQPFDTVRAMAAFTPRALRIGAFRNAARFVNAYFEDFRHRFTFSFHPLFVGGNPFESPAIYLMIPYLERTDGVWYTPGGMYSLVRALERVLVGIGGRVHTSAEVTGIEVEGRRATGVRIGERVVQADVVASNADVAYTYTRLLSPRVRRRWTDARLQRLEYTMSCFLLYVGCRRPYPELTHHTLILSERYRELLRDIFRRKVVPPDFSMYLHAPTRTDPSMAPAGCESLCVLVPVANLAAGVDWSERRDAYAQRILAVLEDWGLSGLRENVEVLRIFTPDDFQAELNAHLGNAFGLEPRLTQIAYFRPHNRSEDVANLYLVGAGTHPGAGVPGVLLSAEATERTILADLARS